VSARGDIRATERVLMRCAKDAKRMGNVGRRLRRRLKPREARS
jgi:hypothetical protein